jgi:predicted MFS family arabinose efflux permease
VIPGAGSVSASVNEWKAGWKMLAATMVCYCSNSLPATVTGALIEPLGSEFSWSRASVSSGVLIFTIGSMLFGPVVGHVVDRVGARRVALVGLPLQALTMGLVGLAGPSLWSWYISWSLLAFGQAWNGAVVWLNAVVSRFDRNRGLALAIALSFVALTYGLIPSFAVYVISTIGWRWIFFIFAGATLLVGWPLAFGWFYSADDLARETRASGSGTAPPPRRFPREALRSREFWRIAVALTIGAASVSTLLVHIQPVLIDAGVSASAAATVLLVFGAANVLGRFGAGYSLDRFPAHVVAAVVVALPCISYTILLAGQASLPGAYVCGFFLGLASGAEADLLAFLVSRYFRVASFSTIFGVLLGIFSFGYGLSPVVAGAVFDAIGSYRPWFMAICVLALVGALVILSLGPPRQPTPGGEWEKR